MNDELKTGEVEVVDAPPEPGSEIAVAEQPLPPGVQPSANYLRAVQIGHVLARSEFYPDARDPAKAAVKVMVGMDLGVSPTAALQAIHVVTDSKDRVSFIIEGKLLGSVIKQRDGYDYKVVERTEKKCTLRFFKDGEPIDDEEGLAGPDVSFTIEDAERADLTKARGGSPSMYAKYPEEMLFWRCLAKGIRIHFPELLSGQPVYVQEERPDLDGDLKKALEPGRPAPLGDARSEAQRAEARGIFDEIKEINAERLPPGRFASMIANAEHSHERLDAVVESLKDLRDTEKQIAELSEKLAEELPADVLKSLMARAERRGSNRERVELLEEALVEAKATNDKPDNNKKEETDGSSGDAEA